VGHSWMRKEPCKDVHRELFKAFCHALRAMPDRPDPGHLRAYREFRNILKNLRLKTVYQPVVELGQGSLFGWEAFTRGPEDSLFEKPAVLFDFAAETGDFFVLEKACREQSLLDAGPLKPHEKLFINLHFQSLYDPRFTSSSLLDLVHRVNLKAESIVLEFNERDVGKDFSTLLEILKPFRKDGFGIAIDDVGGQHSNLRRIPELLPDYIKLDTSLVRGVDSSPFQRPLVETFIGLSEKLGCKTIAKGVETEMELNALASMGAHMAQGNVVALPSYPKASVSVELPHKTSIEQVGEGFLKCSMPVKSLVQSTLRVSPRTTVKEVKQMLQDKPPMGSVVVLREGRPAGLLMSYNLDRHLGTQFGVSLFYHREVYRIMDTEPLVVEEDEPVEEVARAAMKREPRKLYDNIVVVREGLFTGTVSVQKILDTLAEVQVEVAKGANPLTGLPGNNAIEEEIKRRIQGKIPSSLIYLDLDCFKVYNDVYGFEEGDKVILFTSEILKEVVHSIAPSGAFVGHVGGDDFLVISRQEHAEAIAEAVAALFEERVSGLYSTEDRLKGCIVAEGRDGEIREFPFISISIGIVDCDLQAPFTMGEMSQRVAEVKKYAKSIPGNSYVRDRRPPLGRLS